MTRESGSPSPWPFARGLLGSLLGIPLAALLLGSQWSLEQRIEPESVRISQPDRPGEGRELSPDWLPGASPTGAVEVRPYHSVRVELGRPVEVFSIELRVAGEDSWRVFVSGEGAAERLAWTVLGNPGVEAPVVRRSPRLRVSTPIDSLRLASVDFRETPHFSAVRLFVPRASLPHLAVAPLPWLLFGALWWAGRGRPGPAKRALELWRRLDLPIAAFVVYAIVFRLAWPGVPGLVAGAIIAALVYVLSTIATVAAVAILAPRVLEALATSAVEAKYDLTIDHRLKPNGDDVNADGVRFRGGPEDLREEDFVVAFLGDSFTFGLYLEDHEAYPQVFESLYRDAEGPRLRAVNFGWASSSPLLGLRLLRQLGARYKPDLLVYNLDMTDFHDDLKNERLLRTAGEFEVDSRELVQRLVENHLPGWNLDLADALGLRRLLRPGPPVPVADTWFPDDRYFATALPLEATREWIEAGVVKNLAAMHQYATETLGIPMALVVLPRAYQYTDRESPTNWESGAYQPLGPHVQEPFRYFEEVADELPYPVISLLEPFASATTFPLYFDRDPHWNADGSRLAAESVARALEELELLPVARPDSARRPLSAAPASRPRRAPRPGAAPRRARSRARFARSRDRPAPSRGCG